MNTFLKFILILFTCFLAVGSSVAQETLDEKRKRADQLFDGEKWAEAEPLYAAIISTAPRDHDLNYRYGTCLLLGSKNKEEAIKRLRFSTTSGAVDKKAFYYLGRAYHLNYQFNDAIKQYKRFKETAPSNDLKAFNVDTDIEACKYGKKLLSNITDMIVMRKTELNEGKFYDLYELDDIGGTLLVTDQYQTKYDKKVNHRAIIHLKPDAPAVYFSSYGDDGSDGLDIYVRKRLPGGDWSMAQKVRGAVNTAEDEDYAYMHPGGEYLYFCSKGHNSMGGYDVFRSRYNPSNDSFGPPENLDFAISSPDDDLLFIVDSLDRNAYFSSARESEQGKLTVYKVRVDRIPMQMAVIKGEFFNTVQANQKEVTIEVVDFSSGALIGSFSSKKTNGDYLITFPKSGKYKFKIQVKGSEYLHEAVIDVPYIKEFRPLKQEMTLKLDDFGEERIEINPLYNELFDDPVAIMAEVYRELSKLPPNVESFDIDSLDAVKETDDVFVDVGLDPFMTKDGLEKVVADELEKLERAQATELEQAAIAYNLAAEKNNEANELMEKVNAIIQQAEGVDDPKEKKRILETIFDDKSEIERLNNEAGSLIELAQAVENSAAQKEGKIAEATNVLNAVKAAPDGERETLVGLVKSNEAFFVENVKGSPQLDNAVTTALQNGADQQKKVQELSEEISEVAQSRDEILAENNRLKKQLAGEKKKKVIEEIQAKIDNNESELAVLDRSIATKTKKLDEIVSENEEVRKGVAAALVLKDEYNTARYTKELTTTDKAAIRDQVNDKSLEENLAVVDEILESNDVSSFNIDLYASNEQNSSYSLQEWDEAIDQEKERLTREKLTASEERKKQLDAELKRLEQLREEKRTEFEVVEENPTEIKPEINQDDIVPNYSGRKESIGEIVNETDRKKANLDLNNELAEELAVERKKLEEILEADPKNKNARERLDNLQLVEDELNAEIKQDEQWLAASEGNEDFDADQVLTNLAPNYQQKINEAYTIVNDDERNKAIENLNEIVLEKSNERIQELQAIVASDPNNAAAQEELTYLQNFARDLEADKSQALVEPEVLNPDELSASVALADLVPDYDRRKKIIDGIKDDYQRKTDENKLYNEVLIAAQREQAKLDRALIKYPDNKTLTKRKKNVGGLQVDIASELEKNKAWLADQQPENEVLADRSALLRVSPGYQARVNQIDEIANKGERKDAILELNGETLDKINSRLTTVEETLGSTPNDQAALAEQEALTSMRDQLEANDNRLLLKPSTPDNLSVSPTLEEVMPAYANRLNAINLADFDEGKKAQERMALNQEMLSQINFEIRNAEEMKFLYPKKGEKMDERKKALEALKAEIELAMEADKAAIDSIQDSAVNRLPVSVDNLMPAYATNLSAIQNSDRSPAEKLEEENKLHGTLMGLIDGRIDQLEAERNGNPDLSAVISGEIDQLNNLRAEKEGTVAANTAKIAELNTGDQTATASNDNNATGDQNTGSTTDNENNAARTAITIGTLMPSYQTDLAALENSGVAEINRLEQENELHNALIGAIDWKLGELKTEQENNPDLSATIALEIDQLNNLRAEKEGTVAANTAKIAELNAGDQAATASNDNNATGDQNTGTTTDNENNAARTAITVGTLMPSYETDLAALQNSDAPEISRLEQENELHNALIGAIDWKLGELKTEQENNPDLSATIEAEIDQLNNLRSEKESTVTTNTANIAELNASDQTATASNDNNATGDQNTGATTNNDNTAGDQTTTTDNDNNASRPAITINTLMSSYDADLIDIENSQGTAAEKLELENEVYQELIDLSNAQLAKLTEEQNANPDQAASIQQNIDEVEAIRNSAEEALRINTEELAASENTVAERPVITVNSLVPDFDQQMAQINAGNQSEIEKLEERNTLNASLLDAIESKIDAIAEERDNDPDNASVYNEEIDKLEELKESKRNEIQRDTDAIANLEPKDNKVSDLTAEAFNTAEGKAAVTDLTDELSEIKSLENELEALNSDLENAEGDKAKAKIEKKIQKAVVNKAELENEVIESLANSQTAEINQAQDDLQADKEATTGKADTTVKEADQNLIVATQKVKQAIVLRNEAADLKDPIEANEKLKKALALEQEAQAMTEEAGYLYKTARIIENTTVADVITAVPDNPSERQSVQLLEEAGELREAANAYYDRAAELRDSSETVKTKYRQAIVLEAEALELKAGDLELRADEAEEQAAALEMQEDQLAAQMIDNVQKNVSESEKENTTTSEAYAAYFEQKSEGDQQLKQAEELGEQIAELKNKKALKVRKAIVLSGGDWTENDVEDDAEISAIQNEINSLTSQQQSLRDEALENYAQARQILSQTSAVEQENMIALQQQGVAPSEKEPEGTSDFEVPDVLVSNIFRTTQSAVYSEAAPIPVSEKQPEGLVYKVQVGAFRNPLPQDHFKEFAPISGEKLNNGITRYMVGYFKTFDPASQARGQVRDLGYGDAFVVAYCNGLRITIDQARQVEQGTRTCEEVTAGREPVTDNTTNTTNDTQNNTAADNTTTTDNNTNTADNTNATDNVNTTTDNTTTANNNTTTDNTTTTNNNTTDNNATNTSTNLANVDLTDQSNVLDLEPQNASERALTAYYNEVPDAAEANQIEIIKGLFYTVQIGVYSKPVPNSALFNIQPLNSQRTASGFIRYSTGIFTSEEAATVRKNEVVQIGIPDAFVTAYFNGERITMEEALAVLVREGADAFVGSEKNLSGEGVELVSNAPEKIYREGLHYRILIGKYRDAIPGEYATLLLQSENTFETEVDVEGRTCLISTKLESMDELLGRLTEFADLGIEDMDILTYYKYDVIPFEEGEKIRKGEELTDGLHPYEEMTGVSANPYIYNKGAVYFKVKLGEFEDKVPTEFTNLILLHEADENINKEETINDETVFYTGSLDSYEEAEATKERLLEKGFDRAVIMAYHKYDEISVEKAREILEE